VPFPGQPIRRQPPQQAGEADASAQELAVADVQGQLERLRPLAVLVLSSDRNFRIVISLLLTRRGCSVIVGRLVEPASREPADVVLIDGGQSQATVTRSVQIARALAPSVGVVLVASAPVFDSEGLPLVARWGPFPELFAAIQRADQRRRPGRG
jgi:hypothetical protein